MAEKKKEERSLEPAGWPRRRRGPFWDLGFGSLLPELFSERLLPSGGCAPAVDMSENDAAYVVTVELPGVKREDVSIEIAEDVLSIHGEKKSEREEKSERRHYVERSFGSFSRSFTLPAHVAADRIKASFRDGVLTIEIPKIEAKKPQVVDIKVG
jgi:HSP20 family protein